MPMFDNGAILLEGATPDKQLSVGDSVVPFLRTDIEGNSFNLNSLSGGRYLLVLLSSLRNTLARDKFIKYRDAVPELTASGYRLVVVTNGTNGDEYQVINDIRNSDDDGKNKIEGVNFPVIGNGDDYEIINTYVQTNETGTRRDLPVYVVDGGKITQIIDGDAINDSEILNLLTQPTPVAVLRPPIPGSASPAI